jgi:erythritol transport system permease protein
MKGFSIWTLLMRMRSFIFLILVLVFFSLNAPNFITTNNFLIMTKHGARYAIIAIGMTYVILSGGIDLSVGSIVAIVGMIVGWMLERGVTIGDSKIYFSVWFILIVGMVVGALVGVVNGLLVTRFKVAPFIATLGTMYIASGFAALRSGGETYADLAGHLELDNMGFAILGNDRFLGVYLSIWIMIAVALLASYVARKTPFGRHIYAVGGNERAAELSGVRVNQIKMAVYIIAGLCSALAGMIITSELMTAHPARGEGFELSAIAAVVLGGTSLDGGRGTIWGTIVGAFVIGVLNDGMAMMDLSSFWQEVIRGSVIVVAVIFDQFQQGLERRAALQRVQESSALLLSL